MVTTVKSALEVRVYNKQPWIAFLHIDVTSDNPFSGDV